MKPWVQEEREIAEDRARTLFRCDRLERYGEVEDLLRAVIAHMVPQAGGIDLVGFLDRYATNPLTRGDKPAGFPEDPEMTLLGMRALERTALQRGKPFLEMSCGEQILLLGEIQQGRVHWDEFDAREFFERLLRKAVTGYYAHPFAWTRIGSPSAAYSERHSRVDQEQVRPRHERNDGWNLI